MRFRSWVACSSGSSFSRSAASSGSMASSTSAARSRSSADRIDTWASSGSSSSTSARRSSFSAPAISSRRAVPSSWMTSARSAARMSSYASSRRAAPCSTERRVRSCTASTGTVRVEPRRNRVDPRVDRRRTNSWSTSQSPVRCCAIDTSSMVTSPEPSLSWTRRSSSSPSTTDSMARCSNRRMLTRPVLITCPASILVTRVSGRNTRRRPGTSTTRPTARGAPLARTSTTTSRTRPTWSPIGSKTTVPARRATKTLVLALTLVSLRPAPVARSSPLATR